MRNAFNLLRIIFKGEEIHVPTNEPFSFIKNKSKHALQWMYDLQRKKMHKQQTKKELSGCFQGWPKTLSFSLQKNLNSSSLSLQKEPWFFLPSMTENKTTTTLYPLQK